MKQSGGLANPLLYFVLLSSAMFAVSALYQMGATSMNPEVFAKGLPHASKTAFSVALIGSILVVWLGSKILGKVVAEAQAAQQQQAPAGESAQEAPMPAI